ncbi:MAG: hypothetical protein ACXVA9_05755 [Bdellovibrionales bacterium]
MKSLIVTAVVLSSFGMQTFAADQAPDKGKGSSSDQVSPAARDAREHLPLPGGKRPETNAPATASPRAAAPAPAATPKTAAPAPVEKAPPVRMTENKSPAAGAPIKATPPAQKTPVTAAPTQQAPTKQTSAQQTPATQKPPLVTKAPPTGPVIQQPPGKQGPAQKAPGNQVSRNQVPPGAQNSRPGAPAVIRPQVMPPNAQGKHALTPAQIHEVQLKNQRLAQQNPHVHNFVEQRGQFYREHYNAQLVRLQSRYAAPAFLSPLRLQYRPWIKVGFFAYAYPVRPVVEFYTYFSNPCVAWFYNDYDADFYQPY